MRHVPCDRSEPHVHWPTQQLGQRVGQPTEGVIPDARRLDASTANANMRTISSSKNRLEPSSGWGKGAGSSIAHVPRQTAQTADDPRALGGRL